MVMSNDNIKSTLSLETQYVQNPALGAILLWRYIVGYERGSGVKRPTPIPLLYIVLPILMHEQTYEFVSNTYESSGLRAFATKFTQIKASSTDLLLAIHDRSSSMRILTTDSLAISIASGLTSLDKDHGLVFALSHTPPKAGIPKTIEPLLRASEKLGVWCSSLLLKEISLILKVGF